MTAVTAEQAWGDDGPKPMAWGWYLCAGLAWILISISILSFDPGSAVTIAYLMAFVLIAAGISEFVEAAMAPGWKWVHAILGVLFVLGGIASLTAPFQTFGILALLMGWYLVFKGSFDIAFSITTRSILPLWGLLLASGILQVLIGIWALGYPGRSAWLLVLWAGIGALMRGFTDLFLAFHVRSEKKHAAA